MKTIKAGEVWTLTETTALEALTIEDGGSILAPQGKIAVMTIDGTLYDLLPGTYEGHIVITVAHEMPKFNEYENNYRSALVFGSDGLDSSRSILAAAEDVSLENGAAGGTITVRGHQFNGISCEGGKTKISGTKFDYVGNGGDDFELFGSAIAVGGDAKVVVDKADIVTKGVTATAVAASGTSEVLVMNSSIDCCGTDNADWHTKHPHLSEVPWVLGLKGTLRATNVLEAANVTYYDSRLKCNGWGVLSIDAAKGAKHNMINIKATIPDDEGYASGYGAYLLGGSESTFLGCEFDVPDFVFSVGGNDQHAIVGPSTRENLLERADRLGLLEEEVGLENIPQRPSIARSKRFGGMWHHASTGLFDVRPGSVIEAGECAFLIKSGQRLNQPHILCDRATVTAPVILHLMENDDPGMGVRCHDGCWAPCGEFIYDPKAQEGFDLSDAAADGTVLAEFKSMDLKGNFYNTRWQNAQNLHLVFDSTKVQGVISSGTLRHRDFSYGIALLEDGSKVCTDKEGKPYVTEVVEDLLFGKMPVKYTLPVEDGQGSFKYAQSDEKYPLSGYGIWNTDPQFLGDVDVAAAEPINNGIIVELKNGAEWVVTGESHITSLTIGEGCRVVGSMTLDGAEIQPLPGTYKGRIRLSK